MKFIKANAIQIVFMLIALSLLAYGYCNKIELIMAISSAMAMAVWFIDAVKNTKKSNILDKEIAETKNKVEKVEDNQQWRDLK
jgi:Ca2+/Na+ antiporter